MKQLIMAGEFSEAARTRFNSEAMLVSERAAKRWCFPSQRLRVATKNKGGRKIPPYDLASYRAKIPFQQRAQIQAAQPSVHKLHAMDVLILRKHGSLVQERRELLKKRVTLAVGHKRQTERRCYRVHSPETPLAKFQLQIFDARIDQNHARVGDVFPKAVEEAPIDLKNQQLPIGRQLFEQRVRDCASAGS
jgi:hypothetical protein